MSFIYTDDNLSFTGRPNDNTSKFGDRLITEWRKKMVEGCFRYKLVDLCTKIYPYDKCHFVTQVNVRRATERRKPQAITDIVMPFDDKKFHFGKVPKNEELFTIYHADQTNFLEEDIKENITSRGVFLINVSPLEFGHSLLVPDILKCLPQVLTFNALRTAVEVMLLNRSSYFRMGYNSLGAYASVNHLHFHAYYLDCTLFLEHAPVRKLIGNCYEQTSLPSEGFAFEIKEMDDILPIVNDVMTLVTYLMKKQIAHNVFLTRGDAFNSLPNTSEYPSLRIFVWARKSSFGIKEEMNFNPAVCELAGHIIFKDENPSECITEEIANSLYNVCHDTFISVKNQISKLYEADKTEM